MARNICRTVYGSALQTARHLGAQHVIPEYSSLNQWVPSVNKNGMVYVTSSPIQPILAGGGSTNAFSNAAYVQAADSDKLKSQFLAIGNMGHKNFVGADASSPPYTGPIPHMARHSGLYGMIPFVLRQQGNDLSAPERANYRFRCWVTIGGNKYIAYFLRKLTSDLITVEMKYVTVTAGVPSETAFTPVASDLLNPTKPGMAGAPIITTGDYLATTARVTLNFSAAEVQEMINVANLLYGNADQAIVSEFAICTGLDKDSLHSYNGTSRDTTPAPEAIGVQVSTFLSAYYPMVYTNDGYTINLNLGATEPLYGIETT